MIGNRFTGMAIKLADKSSFGSVTYLYEFDAINEKDGVEFEYKILGKLYPGFTTLQQSHIFEGDRVFDLIKISANGHKREVWFDISGLEIGNQNYLLEFLICRYRAADKQEV